LQGSKSAAFAGVLGAVILGFLLAGPLLSWIGIAPPVAGFGAFLLALLISPVALGLGIAALWNTRAKAGLEGKKRAWLGTTAGLVGVAVIGLVVVTRGFNKMEFQKTLTDLVYQVAYHPRDFLAEQTREFSPLNDLSSDPENPPGFPASEAALPDLDWARDANDADLQDAVYPGLKTLHVGVEPAEALALAVVIAEEMGWQIRDLREEDGEFEATDTSAVFGFVDDISVRMARSDKCVIPAHSYCRSTAVDVRSRSRDGESDLGANAGRICTFYDRLWVATGLRPDQSRHRCLKIGRFRARP
jgi:hypothetical protein